MDIEMLKAVRSRIAASITAGRFDMGHGIDFTVPESLKTWPAIVQRGEYPCGTLCCIAGETVIEGFRQGKLFKHHIIGLQYADLDGAKDMAGGLAFEPIRKIAAELLDLNHHEAEYLFYGHFARGENLAVDLDHVTGEQVLAYLDRLIAGETIESSTTESSIPF